MRLRAAQALTNRPNIYHTFLVTSSRKRVISQASVSHLSTTVAKHSICPTSIPVQQVARPGMSVTPSTDPLVWIDCEMTGLDPTQDIILSISCYVTDYKLDLLDQKGYHAVISTPASVLSSMNDWCIKTHTATGLVDACQSSLAISSSQAAGELLRYIKQHVSQPRVALLAGNSVHADKMFLMLEPWTPVMKWLHYRIFDVSAMKEAIRRWGSEEVVKGIPKKKLTHSADEDIRESLEEAKYYMKLVQTLAISNKD